MTDQERKQRILIKLRNILFLLVSKVLFKILKILFPI